MAPISQPSRQLATNSHYLHQYLSTAIAFLVLDVVFVTLRFVSRRFAKKAPFGWDDALTIPALLSNVALCISACYVAHWSFVVDTAPLLTPEIEAQFTKVTHGIYVEQMLYIPAFTFPKLVILSMYLRIFSQTSRKYVRIATWATMQFVLLNGLAFLFAFVFICTPIKYFWNRTIPGGTCVDYQTLDRVINGPSIAADLIILALPLHTVWKLNASPSRRIGIMATFLTGAIGTIASIVRWAFILKYSVRSTKIQQTVFENIFTIVEASCYLIASCLPAMRPLASALSSEWVSSQFSSIFRSSGSGGSSGGRRSGRSAPTADQTVQPRPAQGSLTHLVDGQSAQRLQPGHLATAGQRTSAHEADMDRALSAEASENGKVGVHKDVWVGHES